MYSEYIPQYLSPHIPHLIFFLFFINVSANTIIINLPKLFIKLISIQLCPQTQFPLPSQYPNIPVSNNLLIPRHHIINCIQAFFHNAICKLQLSLNFPFLLHPYLPVLFPRQELGKRFHPFLHMGYQSLQSTQLTLVPKEKNKLSSAHFTRLC